MKEVYKIKFSKWFNEQNVPCYTMYTLGAPGWVDGELLTPKKIRIKDDTVIVFFEELGIQHKFAVKDDLEVFYRDKVKKDADKTEDNTI